MSLALEYTAPTGARASRAARNAPPWSLSVAQTAALFGLFAFAGSLLLSPFYTTGDQEAYKPLYEEIRDYPDWGSKFAFLTVGPFSMAVGKRNVSEPLVAHKTGIAI